MTHIKPQTLPCRVHGKYAIEIYAIYFEFYEFYLPNKGGGPGGGSIGRVILRDGSARMLCGRRGAAGEHRIPAWGGLERHRWQADPSALRGSTPGVERGLLLVR